MNLTKKDAKFIFGVEQASAFYTLKDKLCNESLINPIYETKLHTEASSFGYGACLLQRHPGFYVSYKTTEIENRYASYELEVLAIVCAVKKFEFIFSE